MSQQPITVTVGQGRYAVTIGTQGELTATRHGERWRELAGDKLVYFLAYELHEAREALFDLADAAEGLSGLDDYQQAKIKRALAIIEKADK